jgi:phenylacetate-CoA ligase
MLGEHTSGTTGKPLRLWFSRDTVRQWYALFEARWRRAYGVSRHDRWANIGGQLVTPVRQQRPPFWVWNAALKQLYMSSYHLSAKLLPYYLEALIKYRITYLYGYTSSLCALAQEADRQGWRESQFKVALTNAEPLLKHQRQIIQNGLNCPVRETFGMSEIVANASECERGRMHLWPEVGIVEVLDGDRPAHGGTTGDMVCTGLLNSDMPLIRYRLGDRGCLPADESACPCGRSLPCLAFVEGRTDDVLLTSDGRRVGRLDPVFKADLPIYEAQIIQESLGQIRVRYVPAPGYTAQHSRSIIERLQQRIGSVNVILEPVPEIPRGPNGKFRAVVSKLSTGAVPATDTASSTLMNTASS